MGIRLRQTARYDRNVAYALLTLVCACILFGCHPANREGRPGENATAPVALESAQELKPSNDSAAESWDQRFSALNEDNSRAAFALGQELAELPSDEGYELLKNHWSALPATAKQQIIKSWSLKSRNSKAPDRLTQRSNPYLIRVLHLGATDPSSEVQKWAFLFLKRIAFVDFEGESTAYLMWYEHNAHRPLLDVMEESCRGWVARMKTTNGSAVSAQVLFLLDIKHVFRDVPSVRQTAREAGLLGVLEEWVALGVQGGGSVEEKEQLHVIMETIRYLEPSEEYLRLVIVPLLTEERPAWVQTCALVALSNEHNAWAADLILALLQSANGWDEEAFAAVMIWGGTALGEFGEPKVIPMLIALIDADNTEPTVYGLGHFALRPLTGVAYQESHDGAWWHDWWESNKGRFPEPVRSLDIPQLPKRQVVPKPDENADVADVPSQDLHAAADQNKRYFLIGSVAEAQPPSGGYRLLVVLPGGDGSADFHSFVKRVFKNALPKSYLVAQLVAPQWRNDEDRVVWPTRGLPDQLMKFSTEEFIEAVIGDVSSRHEIDARRIFAMGWSSGGPPVYATLAQEQTAVRGAFVAMSVFHPNHLPPLSNTKGRSCFILHSPQDFIRMSFPEAARDLLSEAGATVELMTYPGGHGWQGDVYGNIRKGIEWLEKQQDERP